MNKENRLFALVGIITIAAAVAATVASIFIFFEKKRKTEKEIDEYLDCSIM